MYSLNVCAQCDHLPVITTMIPIAYQLCSSVQSHCNVQSHWSLKFWLRTKRKAAAILYIHDFSPSSLGLAGAVFQVLHLNGSSLLLSSGFVNTPFFLCSFFYQTALAMLVVHSAV